MGTYLRIVNWLDRSARFLGAVLVAAIGVLTLTQIFFRYVLNDSLIWSIELNTYLLVWLAFIGAAVVTLKGDHPKIPTFIALLPQTVRPYVIIGATLVPIAFLVYVAFYGIEVVTASFNLRSVSMGFSTKWVKLAMPVGGIIMLIFIIYVVAKDIVEFRCRNYKHFDEQVNVPLDFD